MRPPETMVFPLAAVAGRGSLTEIAIGGVVGLEVSYRLYLIVNRAPAEDIVQRTSYTLSHIANIILGSFREVPYWWFTRINGIEVPIHAEAGYTVGMLDGTINGLGHPIAPFPP